MCILRPLLAVVLTLAVTGVVAAQPKPAELIVGKWQIIEKKDGMEVKITMDFLKDGKLNANVTLDGKELINVSGTYKVLENDTLEITFDMSQKSKFKVNDKELIITEASGKESKLTRVK
jgi:uncharacterized protein (TIGR03066 family)